MINEQLSANFKLSEFGWVQPDKRLLFIMQWLRIKTGAPIHINDTTRTVKQHVDLYRKLEKENKLRTLGNGLGTKTLLDLIPWESRHLCDYTNPTLRAVDFTCEKHEGGVYTGSEVRDLIEMAINSSEMLMMLDSWGYEEKTVYVGVGVGMTFNHLDVDRERNTFWGYGY